MTRYESRLRITHIKNIICLMAGAKQLWLSWSIFSSHNSWEVPHWWLACQNESCAWRLRACSAQEAGCSYESGSPWQQSSEMKGGSPYLAEITLAARAMGPTFNFKPRRSRSSHGPRTQRLLLWCGGRAEISSTWYINKNKKIISDLAFAFLRVKWERKFIIPGYFHVH